MSLVPLADGSMVTERTWLERFEAAERDFIINQARWAAFTPPPSPPPPAPDAPSAQ
ncbi:hypothetical protein CEP54_002112 [Fusarium duplospermum]|uniref:Uncharacterized protein n=1 Tax=Fusarium duplospermum TaxID=1325734 RepID=A0A428QWH5_9HYPO|nr:hypothetical protein CEP54_002112 [Fusarium duplospermum]